MALRQARTMPGSDRPEKRAGFTCLFSFIEIRDEKDNITDRWTSSG
jgi:hypothetical protein